jgi:hypothetical protein
MIDIIKSGQTGPSKNADDPSKIAKQSRTDIEVTGQPNDEKRLAKTLKSSMSQPNQATYSRKGR